MIPSTIPAVPAVSDISAAPADSAILAALAIPAVSDIPAAPAGPEIRKKIQKTKILQVSGLSVQFETSLGRVQAADNVSFEIFENETLALVGETGCGKSIVASAIMQLLPKNAKSKGNIEFRGRNLLDLGEEEMAGVRGAEIAIIFQNPSLSLNPVVTIGDQIAEMLQVHVEAGRSQSIEKAAGVLQRLGLGERSLLKMYPFQFSGGMNQRVMIASALMLSPRIIIADEPTKGLDSATAAGTVQEMKKMKDLSGASLLLITHDPALVESIADRVAVMYCGEILEIGPCRDVFQKPLHPYTKALLDCLPERGLHPIPGASPSMTNPPQGCKFHPRCPMRCTKCSQSPLMKRMKRTEWMTQVELVERVERTTQAEREERTTQVEWVERATQVECVERMKTVDLGTPSGERRVKCWLY